MWPLTFLIYDKTFKKYETQLKASQTLLFYIYQHLQHPKLSKLWEGVGHHNMKEAVFVFQNLVGPKTIDFSQCVQTKRNLTMVEY